MRLSALLLVATALAASSLLPLAAAWGETPEEAASRARSLLTDPNVFGVATLSTPYPSDFSDPFLAGSIASGPEYFASCFDNGDLLFVALTVSQNWRNVLQHPNATAVVSISSNPDPSIVDPRHTGKDAHHWDPSRPSWRKGMPSKQRITLFGKVVQLGGHSLSADEHDDLARCFLAAHPDAKYWAPGAPDSPHIAKWARLQVERVYRVGGFGDESAIGWIPIEDWRRAGAASSYEQGSPEVESLFAENVGGESVSPQLIRQHARDYLA